MKNVIILILLLFVFVVAEDEYRRFNEYNMQPEVWHFTGPVQGQVDAKGDLNLSLPMMTVPGRNGLNFPINFSYKAGIRYHQQASWIGLGFNFDPGSITRDVQGNYLDDLGNSYGVDYAGDDFNLNYLPDSYYLSIPGKGTFTMGRANIAGFNNPADADFHFPENGNSDNQFHEFYLEEYQPYKIEYDIGSNFKHAIPEGKEDITRFTITTDEGYRYIYGLPSVAAYKSYVGNDHGIVYYYPNAWRLLAILSPNVSELINEDIFLQNYNDNISPSNIYENTQLKNCDWIIFKYRFDDSKGVFSSEVGSESHYVQNTYLKYVITPTHYATFNTGTRGDCDLATFNSTGGIEIGLSDNYKKLISIELKTKNDALIKKVLLHHDYYLGKGTQSTHPNGKLTLNKIEFFSGDNKQIPGYLFDYVDGVHNPEWSGDPNDHYYDGYGYYNSNRSPNFGIDDNTTDAQAWCLNKVTFPTGGCEEYEYENDNISTHNIRLEYIDKPTGNTGFLNFSFDDWKISGGEWKGCKRQGGIKVKKITKSDGMGGMQIDEYSYLSGSVPTVPPKLLPYDTDRLGLPPGTAPIRSNEFHVNNRGDIDVVYSFVEKKTTDENGEIVLERFWYNNNGTKNTMLFYSNLMWILFFDTDELFWGLPRGKLIKKEKILSFNNPDKDALRETIEYKFQSANKSPSLMLPFYSPFSNRQYYVRQISTRLKRELITISGYYSNPSQITVKEYEYLDKTNQVKIATTTTGNNAVQNTYLYAHEIYEYGGPWNTPVKMKRENNLNLTAQSTTKQLSFVDEYIEPVDIQVCEEFGKKIYVTAHAKGCTSSSDQNIENFTVEYEQNVAWACTLDTDKIGCSGIFESTVSFRIRDLNTGGYIVNKFGGGHEGTGPTYDVYEGEFRAFPGITYEINANVRVDNGRGSASGYIMKSKRSFSLANSNVSTYTYISEKGWKPKKIYSYKTTENTCQTPVFDGWDNSSPTDNNWIRQFTINDYKFGKPIEFTDANGNVQKLYYGDNDNPESNDYGDDDFQHSKLTCVKIDAPTLQKKTFKYDNKLSLPNELIDENNKSTFFEYDGFGRLSRVINSERKILSENSYYYSLDGNNGQFNRTDPNYVQTAIFQDDASMSYLCGYWRFENDVLDASGNNNNGTVSGAVYDKGYLGRGMKFDGNDYINAGSSNNLDITNAITISAWVKHTSGSGHIVNRGGGWGDPGYSMFWYNGKIRIELQKSGEKALVDNIAPPSNSWNHIAFTWDQTSKIIKVYINGKLAPQTKTFNGPIGLPSQNLNIGRNELRTFCFRGLIDEVKIYNAALTSEEVKGLYNATTSIQYSDGLARNIQTISVSGNQDIIMAKSFNNVGQITKQYKPYIYASDHQYQPDFAGVGAGSARNYYNGNDGKPDCGIYPYTEYIYKSPGTSLTETTYFPGAQNDKNAQFNAYTYVYAKHIYPAYYTDYSVVWYEVKKTNENGEITYSYYDESNNLRYSRIAAASGNVDTYFEYDAMGNLLEVLPPNYFDPPAGSSANDWITSYKYNTLGQMTEKNTPDAGTVRYKYDANGNLRFTQDANNVDIKNNVNIHINTDTYSGTFIIKKTGLLNWSITAEDVYDPATGSLLIRDSRGDIKLDKEVDLETGGESGYVALEPGVYTYSGHIYREDMIDPHVRMICNSKNNVNVDHYTTNHTFSGTFTVNLTGILGWSVKPNDGYYSDYDAICDFTIKRQGAAGNIIEESFDLANHPYGQSGQELLEPGVYTYTGVIDRTEDVETEIKLTCISYDELLYTKYDALNRPTEEGIYAGAVSFANANTNIANFPTANYTIMSKYYYDNNGYSGARNLIGRLTKVEYRDKQSGWGKTYYSYDDNGNMEWTIQDLPGVEMVEKKIEYDYDLQGKVTKVSYNRTVSADEYFFWYEYNQLGQLEKVYSAKTNSQPSLSDACYTYTPSGQVDKMQLSQASGGYKETMDYAYTPRGWLDNINAPNPSLNFGQTSLSAFTNNFATKLYYGNPVGGTPQYNGNISQAEYFTKRNAANHQNNPTGSFVHRYSFGYDDQSRLTSANFFYKSGSNYISGNSYRLNIGEYDAMGNIEKLNRYSKTAAGNQYNYKYQSGTNRLLGVQGLHSNYNGNYNYDANGNMTGDASKGIGAGSIKYDRRNLPYSIAGSKFNLIYNGYDHTGNRIYKKKNEKYGIVSAQYYINDAGGKTIAVYDKDGNQLFVNLYGMDQIGKFTRGSAAQKYFYLKDHLGNIRVTINSLGAVKGYDDYYPFGLQMPDRSNNTSNPNANYKYSGKELDEESLGPVHNLDLYCFGARNYDPEIGVWRSVDPLDYKYPSNSPYNYVLNDPMIFRDPDGKGVLGLQIGLEATGFIYGGGVNVSFLWDHNGSFHTFVSVDHGLKIGLAANVNAGLVSGKKNTRHWHVPGTSTQYSADISLLAKGFGVATQEFKDANGNVTGKGLDIISWSPGVAAVAGVTEVTTWRWEAIRDKVMKYYNKIKKSITPWRAPGEIPIFSLEGNNSNGENDSEKNEDDQNNKKKSKMWGLEYFKKWFEKSAFGD